ncbi:MAG: hypothetical protein HQ515_18860 [Phycisphaeraceae bacterium]|nr:hypothetical protein [Phycisphaeraceae bacterium]
MNTARFIHQQVFQLKWHILACLGLIMILPVEETIVSLHDGDGFSYTATVVTFWLTPLLAALIACANVQGDLDERRDLFWRSKPVGVCRFISGKFLIGIVLCLVILACPILWMWITTTLSGQRRLDGPSHYYVYSIAFVSLLAYSMCFFCNVLVRKTARAWLIGLVFTCFVLLIPLLLPLNIKDVYADMAMEKWIMAAYVGVILGGTVLAMIGSIVAAQRNCKVHTQLRGLLWGGAGLIFAVILLFSRQIANIQILDEKPISRTSYPGLVRRGDKVTVQFSETQKSYEIETQNRTIELVELQERPSASETAREAYEAARSLAPKFENYRDMKFGRDSKYMEIDRDSGQYRLHLVAYNRTESFIKKNGTGGQRRIYEKAYLRSYRVMEGGSIPLESLDLSDYLERDEHPRLAMGLTEDRVVVLLNKTCLAIDLSDLQAMEVVESKPIKRNYHGPDERVDLIPLESIDMGDRVRLSIQWRGLQCIPTNNDNSDYVTVTAEGMALYKIEKWDEKRAYAKLLDKRSYTFWERMGWRDQLFVRGGKLYRSSRNKLMVFDVSGTRIRKLGHYERLSPKYGIEKIEVDTNGNILMLSGYEEMRDGEHKRTEFLQLLKNPE